MPSKKPIKKSATRKGPVSKPGHSAGEVAPKRVSAVVPKKPAPVIEAGSAPVQEEVLETTSERYWEAVGRRKTAIARVRLFTKGEKGVWINAKPIEGYFHYPYLRQIASEALETMNSQDRFSASIKVSGGGLHAQAEAIRHGTARALVLFNPDFRKRLKRAGFLTRDPRMKERKKFGLKGARRAPQWAKR